MDDKGRVGKEVSPSSGISYAVSSISLKLCTVNLHVEGFAGKFDSEHQGCKDSNTIAGTVTHNP